MRSAEDEQRIACLSSHSARATGARTVRAQEVLRTHGWQGDVTRSFHCATRPPREGPAAMFPQGGWKSVAGFSFVGAKAFKESVATEEAIKASDSSDGNEDAA